MANRDDGRFAHWMSSGLLATVAWFVTLGIYVTFRALKIEDPLLGQAFLLLTGAWVGNLTIAQGKKQAKVEEKVERLEEKAVVIKARVEEVEDQASSSEKRETGWSRHKDHTKGNNHE